MSRFSVMWQTDLVARVIFLRFKAGSSVLYRLATCLRSPSGPRKVMEHLRRRMGPLESRGLQPVSMLAVCWPGTVKVPQAR